MMDWHLTQLTANVSLIGLFQDHPLMSEHFSYYRRFVHEYVFIAHRLHRLAQKQVSFEWTAGCSTAFQTMKDALTSPPILAFPNFHQPFILSTDASNYAVGSVLSQVQNGKDPYREEIFNI